MNEFSTTTVNDCKIIKLTKIVDNRGAITPVSVNYNLPFEIKRIYYLYDIPGGSERGGHAHYELQQYLIAVTGSFNVIINDGKNSKNIHLNRPYNALYIAPGIWRELNNFSYGSVCLVIASMKYFKKDYIRNFKNYCKFKNG